MPPLTGTKTERNLKDVIAGGSRANRRYFYFADVEGLAAAFRSTSAGETRLARDRLEYFKEVREAASGQPIGPTGDNLKAAIASETHEYSDIYPGMARTARREGFDEIADWIETLAKAGKSHADRLQKALDAL